MPANQDDREALAEIIGPAAHIMSAEKIADRIIAAGFTRSAKDEAAGTYRLSTRIGSVSPCIMGEFEEPPHDGPVPHVRSRVICTFHGDDLVPLAERIVALLNGTTIDAPPTQADAGEGAAGVEG